jgi:acetylornithine aminotransferase
MKSEKLLENATKVGRVIRDGLTQGLAGTPGFVEVRGMGMMIGVELDRPCGDIVTMALEQGLVLNVTADSVVRLLPALVMTEAEGRQLVDLLVPVVKSFLARPVAAAPARAAG